MHYPSPSTDAPIQLSKEEFHFLVGKLHGAYDRIDEALAHTCEMTGEMVRAAARNGLTAETGQLLFDDLTTCLGTMVQSRKQLVKAHRRAHVIRMRSTQHMEGCPPPLGEDGHNVVSIAAAA